MKILFLATWFPYPPDSGAKIRVYHLLHSLATAGHDVTLLSFAFDTARPDEPGNLKRWCHQIQVIPVNPFEINQAGPLRSWLSFAPLAFRPIPAMRFLVSQHAKRTAFDAVIASTEVMSEYAFLLPNKATRILEEHNSQTRWMHERYEAQSAPLQRLRCWGTWQKNRYYEARLFRRFDLVTMVSEQDRHTCTTQLPRFRGRVEVIPNGVDCKHNAFWTGVRQSGHLVYNGSLTYRANYDAVRWFLADIYPLIKAQIPEVSLTITGSTKDVDLGGLHLDDSVHLTGYVDDVRLPVAEASVCIVPIRQGGGTRLKILEAMALGTPIVATPKGAEGLKVVDGKHLLLADRPEDFASATVRLLREPVIQASMTENARRLVEAEYDWQHIAAGFVQVVERAAAMKQLAPIR